MIGKGGGSFSFWYKLFTREKLPRITLTVRKTDVLCEYFPINGKRQLKIYMLTPRGLRSARRWVKDKEKRRNA